MAPTGEKGDSPAEARTAYDTFAPAYDLFTGHHDYDLWLEGILPRLEAHGLKGHRLLDVGCGTGKSFMPLLKKNWTVRGCDLSPAMIAIAKAKVGRSAELSVADMRELSFLGEFDLVWALDDAMNYLLSEEELEAALRGMRRNLAPGGLLVFDVNTINTFRTFFTEEIVVERGGLRMIWTGLASPAAGEGLVAEAVFSADPLQGSGALPIAEHLHRQRHHPEALVLATLKRAGLRCLEVYGQFEDAVPRFPLDEKVHDKAMYICCARAFD